MRSHGQAKVALSAVSESAVAASSANTKPQDAQASAYPAAALTDVRSPTFTSFLDFSRWTAAAMVFAGHLRDPLFLGYGEVPAADRLLPVKLWYFVTGWHAEAVVVFFVLSGYLVGGLAAAKLQLGRFSLSSYVIDRTTRIYLAFLPALLLTVLLDYLGTTWFTSAGLYDGTQAMIHQKIAAGSFMQYMSLKIFAYNVVLLQTFFSPSYGSDQPLWTISAEFWFYVVFGCAAAAFLRRGSARGWIALAAMAAVAALLGGYFVELMGLWMLGLAAAFVPRARFERPLVAALTFMAALVLIRFNDDALRASETLRTLKNYAVALSFAWLLVGMRRTSWSPMLRLSGVNQRLADFSYSLYLTHFPLMIFLLSVLYATGHFPEIATGYSPTNLIGLTLYAAIIGLVGLIAWIFSQMTEKRTAPVRRWLHAKIGSGAK